MGMEEMRSGEDANLKSVFNEKKRIKRHNLRISIQKYLKGGGIMDFLIIFIHISKF